MIFRRILAIIFGVLLVSAPAGSTARKPLVLGASGQQQQEQSGDPLQLPASVAGGASLNMPHGTAPTSPVNGDIWTTTAGIFVRVNGATVGPLSTGGGSSTWNAAGANVNVSENTASTSYTNLTTSGPSVTMVTGSVAFIDISAVTFKTTAALGNNAFISVDVSGATTIAAADANGTNVSYTVASSGFAHMLSRRFKLSGLTPGTNTFTLQYRVNGSTFGFDLRSIVVESDTTS